MTLRYCSDSYKIAYTKSDASRALVALLFAERDIANTQGLNVYRCVACRRWHLGHSVTKRGQMAVTEANRKAKPMPRKAPSGR